MLRWWLLRHPLIIVYWTCSWIYKGIDWLMFREGQVMDESKFSIFFGGQVLMVRFEGMGMVGIQMVPHPLGQFFMYFVFHYTGVSYGTFSIPAFDLGVWCVTWIARVDKPAIWVEFAWLVWIKIVTVTFGCWIYLFLSCWYIGVFMLGGIFCVGEIGFSLACMV